MTEVIMQHFFFVLNLIIWLISTKSKAYFLSESKVTFKKCQIRSKRTTFLFPGIKLSKNILTAQLSEAIWPASIILIVWHHNITHPSEASCVGRRCRAAGFCFCLVGCLMVPHGCFEHIVMFGVQSWLQCISPSSSSGGGGRVRWGFDLLLSASVSV